jgi:uncharacterized membrane protein
MIFGRQPAMILNAFSAVIAMMVGLNAIPGLNENVGQAVIAVVSAGTTAWVAWQVRPIAPTIFTGIITSGVAFLAAVDVVRISERQTGLIVAAAEMVLTAIVVWPNSTPVLPSPTSRAALHR